MFSLLPRCALVFILSAATCVGSIPFQTKTQQRPKTARPAEEPVPAEPQDIDTLKTDTNLVTVPVIATDKDGTYLPDLTRDDFMLAEDGVPHEIAFFATVSAPFHVVLMLDTSASTHEKLRLIQEAARVFVEQLQPADRVKVISFDDQVKDLNEFTNDRRLVTAAINNTRSGHGTKLYDAFELALNTTRRIRGRKAIVIFTDGVDWHSDAATFDGTLRGLDEEGVIVYPIRYDTRPEAERLAREQNDQIQPSLPTIDVIRRPPPSGTTAPTFPSDDPGSIPTSGSTKRVGVLGLPPADEILRRRRESEREREIRRDSGRVPTPGDIPSDGRRRLPEGTPDPRDRRDDSISGMLDVLYNTADSYLKNLADKSGGKLLRADVLSSLPDAFSKIAAELRTQYLIGYYPIKKERDDKYRRIKVTSKRKGVLLRSRPGYLATAR
ncbi:MAG TPA: VWA domain-containing protein [Pyrinomonadaceae bacterium]